MTSKTKDADSLLKRYPNRVPVIVSRHTSAHLPVIEQTKFLIPLDMTVCQFILLLRKRIYIESNQSMFIFVQTIDSKHVLVACSEILGDVYNKLKADDGFLYVVYSDESVFGSTTFIDVF
jgi:GABA(A) receptor-associated protein